MKTLVLKNLHLESIAKVLNYPMPFQKGRTKKQFLMIIGQKAQALEKNRVDMLMDLAEKDKDGKPVIENNSYKILPDNMPKWNEEYGKMMMEDCIIDVTPSVEAIIGPVKSMILESSVALDDRDTLFIEEVIKAIDNVKNNKPKEEVAEAKEEVAEEAKAE